MAEEQFYRPASSQEACDLLARFGDKARVLSGGTDLMVAINQRELTPEALIFIGNSGLNYIKEEGDKLIIGAATPYTEIIRSDLVQQKAPLLGEVVSHIGSPAIRNVGTIGGNFGTASPAACSAVGLLGLGASIKIVSKDGERTVAVEDFFKGPGENVLKSNELIQEVIIPANADNARWAYRKLGKRRAQSLAVVSVAIQCVMDNGTCQGIRIAVGAVAPTPLLATQAMALLEGQQLDAKNIDDAAKSAADATNPIDDQRSSAWYRRRATGALVKQLLQQISN
jgi:CO/xanthine dehydrogenase FAD-binding subunit